jgi:hypothetical protein
MRNLGGAPGRLSDGAPVSDGNSDGAGYPRPKTVRESKSPGREVQGSVSPKCALGLLSAYPGSGFHRGRPGRILVAEEGFEPPTQGL